MNPSEINNYLYTCPVSADDDHPELTMRTRRKSVLGSRTSIGDYLDIETLNESAGIEKTKEELEALRKSLETSLLFNDLDSEQLNQLIYFMRKIDVKKGDLVMTQGDDGDSFYVVDSGYYEEFYNNADGGKTTLRTHAFGSTFGELALLYNQPRSTTVVANEAGSLWVLDRHTFKTVVVTNSMRKRQLFMTLLNSFPVLSHLDSNELMNVTDILTRRSYTDGQCIVSENEQPNGMFFIETGQVQLYTKNNEGNITAEPLNLRAGQYFGESALLTEQPQAILAIAEGPVTLAFLNREAFERLLGPCSELYLRNNANQELKHC